MKGKQKRNPVRFILVSLASLLWLAPFGQITIGGTAPPSDPCEREAMRAYLQALKVCQLAESSNPRLRCYEAAKAVYVQTLEACRAEKPTRSQDE